MFDPGMCQSAVARLRYFSWFFAAANFFGFLAAGYTLGSASNSGLVHLISTASCGAIGFAVAGVFYFGSEVVCQVALALAELSNRPAAEAKDDAPPPLPAPKPAPLRMSSQQG